MPRAMGSVNQIQKKTSHITLVLSEIKDTKEVKTGKKQDIKKVTSKERPKDEIKKREDKSPEVEKEKKEKIGETKEQKGRIFRRKSI